MAGGHGAEQRPAGGRDPVYYEDLSIREISAVLGISEAAEDLPPEGGPG